MLKKSNHDFQEKYPYIGVGTIEPVRITDILVKITFFAVRQRFRIQIRHIMT